MLWVWQSPMSRATMDIDMLARQTSNEVERIVAQVKDICAISVQEDGLQFDLESIRGERITEDADYQGVRIRFVALLDKARLNMQIDIGFGDIVVPEPTKESLPTLLDFESPRLMCYSPESAIAGKFEAMIKLAELNWQAFKKKLKQEVIPAELEDVIGQLKKFLEPVVQASLANADFVGSWVAPGPWLNTGK